MRTLIRVVSVLIMLTGMVSANPKVPIYPIRDQISGQHSSASIDGGTVDIQTVTTRHSPTRVAVWYARTLGAEGWTGLGSEEPAKAEPLGENHWRIQAHAPIQGGTELSGWLDLAEGGTAKLPMVMIEISRGEQARRTTIQHIRSTGISLNDRAKRVPPGMISCGLCKVASVIRQAGSMVVIYTGPGGVSAGVGRIRAGAQQGGWVEVASDRDLPEKGAHTLVFSKGSRSCIAAITPGATSWRFQAGVVCEVP